MAITSGFYNSVNHDRLYNATQFSQIFDGIINDGVYMSVLDHFDVKPSEGMIVSVGGGRAWFNHTWTYNDNDIFITIDESEIAANRIDLITLKVDTTDNVRENSIIVVKGVPSENTPEKPVVTDSGGVFYHPLAYISLAPNQETIIASDIENCIGVDPRTPFVTGIIEHVHAEDLVPQWQAEWTQWNNEKRQAYLDWVAQQESDMETWISNTENDMDEWISQQESDMQTWQANHKQQYDTWAAEQEATMTQFFSDERQEVRDWYQHLRDELDEHQAIHLQNQIDVLYDDMDEYKEQTSSDLEQFKEETSAELNEETFKLYHDLCNKNTHIDYSESGDVTQITSNSSDYSAVSVITFEDTETGKIITTTVTKDTNRYIQTVVINNETHDITESYIKEVIS